MTKLWGEWYRGGGDRLLFPFTPSCFRLVGMLSWFITVCPGTASSVSGACLPPTIPSSPRPWGVVVHSASALDLQEQEQGGTGAVLLGLEAPAIDLTSSSVKNQSKSQDQINGYLI